MTAVISEAVEQAADRRADGCDNPRCVGGLVAEAVSWLRPGDILETGALVRTCGRCAGTPTFEYGLRRH
jgi:hypothetical protein